MYFIENNHEAIISRTVFDKAQELMQQRRVEREYRKYPFSLIFYCGECGASLKRRVTNGKPYWVCRNHDKNKDNCPTGRIPEHILEQAFIRMHHKLRLHRRIILMPMMEQLTTLRQRAAFRQDRIKEIDLSIMNIGRQTMTLHRLYSAGHMEAAYYYEQNQNLNQQTNTLRRERYHLMESGEDDAITQTESLLDILSNSAEQLDDFDAGLFKSIISRASLPNNAHVRFELINGLEVTEVL